MTTVKIFKDLEIYLKNKNHTILLNQLGNLFKYQICEVKLEFCD